MKTVDFNESIESLITKDEQIKDILYELGFIDIIKPLMLKTVGKVMTINKGAKFKNIDISKIKTAFINKGYEIKE